MKPLVLITGATGGLGKAFAVECASRGWDLFLTDLEADCLEALAGGLRQAYEVGVRVYPCDLTDTSCRLGLFERIGMYKFWILINVAGLDCEGIFQDRSRDEILGIVRLNIEATLDVTHAMLASMTREETFHIINVASLAAFYPMPVKATYAASKRFLLDFSLALRDEVRELGGTVTALCPAGMPTTHGCIEAIESQGLVGQLTTLDIGQIAAQTVEAALKGQAIIIPGLLNQIIRFLGGLLPAVSVAGLVGRRWRTTSKKRLLTTEA
ncbi:MAG: SDR family NAD(P)-dependent oxidoreductase [Chloroflexota bacterium]